MSGAQKAFAASTVRIPGSIIAELQDLDPAIDHQWEKRVVRIMKMLEDPERRYAYSQFMIPKGIQYLPNEKRFVCKKQPTLREVSSTITHGELRNIANKLMDAIKLMGEVPTAEEFAGHAESAGSLIDQFSSGENVNLQKWKNALRSAYFIELARVAREAKFVVPPNHRGLSADVVKSYILETYVKHQMLGYRFRTLPLGTLEDHSDQFVRTVVAREAKIRQCSIIRSDSSLYLVGPVNNAHQDPYSIRRFLREEKNFQGGLVYFNAAAVATDKLHQDDYKKHVELVLTRIVTLERQLSDCVVERVRQIEEYRRRDLTPLLTSRLLADGSDIEAAMSKRLREVQKRLENQILKRFHEAVRTMAVTQDDFEFLFLSLRNIVIEIGGDIRSFAAQCAAVWSREVVEMDLKLMSLLHLADKRKEQIFTPGRAEKADPATDVDAMWTELREGLAKHEKNIEAIRADLERAVAKRERKGGGLGRLLDKLRKKPTPDELRVKLELANREAFASVVRVMKRYPLIKVYLEFEELIPITDGVRNYALAMGNEGLTRLPVLLRLPEEMQYFDIAGVSATIMAADEWAGDFRAKEAAA